MTSPTLQQLYSSHQNKTSDKWSLYLHVYNDILSHYRHDHVRFLEIGIQNGGSLEIWSKYFPKAEILIGCDINEACRALQYEDRRIRVVVGDANTDATQREIVSHARQFDIIIDDGSHRSNDIVVSFARYFPYLSDGGVYVAEDLHCSYWEEFQGGLFHPQSSISFFKRLADIVNFEHWGVRGERSDILRSFAETFGCDFTKAALDHIHSVEFVNSMCLIRKKKPALLTLGLRIVAGNVDQVSSLERPLNGLSSKELLRIEQSSNVWSNIKLLPEEELTLLKDERSTLKDALQAEKKLFEEQVQQLIHTQQEHVQSLSDQANQLAAELAERTRQLAERAREHEQFEQIRRKQQRELALLKNRYDQMAGELKSAYESHSTLVASRSWRIASALHRVAEKFPRLSHFGWRSAKAVSLIARFKFTVLYRELEQRYHAKRIGSMLSASRLFDADFYLTKYSDVTSYPGGPLRHYILRGGLEGRDPHPLFDGQWYLSSYPYVAAKGINPLAHYLTHKHLSPNPFFDGEWYLEQYPDVEKSGVNPLFHYFEFGASEGRDPSSRFSTQWYLEQNPDIARSHLNPLAHFLRHGLAEGRSPSPAAHAAHEGGPVMRSEIYCFKPPHLDTANALFVAHSPDGKLKPHVRHYLESLKRSGISVTLIVAADAPFDASSDLLSIISGLFVRRNEGYDFAAWAHVLKLRPDFLDSEILYLLNDSLIGPFNQQDFEKMLAAVRDSPADLVGATENHERKGWHLQSFFLALKKKALSSVAFQSFINRVTVLEDKNDVINQYELEFAPHLRASGLNCSALFPVKGRSNPTIYNWRELIEAGFPFIKVMALRDRFDGVDISSWREVLSARGFDVALADRTVNEALSVNPVQHADTLLFTFSASPVNPSPGPLRVSLIAPWNFDNGLGVASRSYISALRHSSFLVNLHPIKRPFHVHRQTAPPFDICDFNGDADVALIQLNPDGWHSMFTEAQLEIINRARLRIGLWVWETPAVPHGWLKVMTQVDAIWAPSQYCADAFSAAVNVPVHVVPYVVAVPSGEISGQTLKSAKQSLGASGNEKIILYAFDGSSYLVRKNPFALVNAFGKARLHEQGWTLVLKTKHIFDSPVQGNALAELVARTPGVVLVNRSLDKDAMRGLMAAASIYASPHCAEGFGLTVAEAMAMGKLVVATNYSGTRDFMDATNGFPVGYQMRTLEETHGAYGSGNAWAIIDEDQLSEALLAAARMADAGDYQKGQQAKRRVYSQLSSEAVAARMAESLRQLLPSERIHSAAARRA